MGSAIDVIIAFFRDRLGERTVTIVGFWAVIVVVISIAYAFFFRQLSNNLDEYYSSN